MEKNIGPIDRAIRAVLVAVLLYFGYTTTGLWMYISYVLAILLLITVITGYCYPYTLLGINTNKNK